MLARKIFKQYWRKRRYSKFSRHINISFMNRFGSILLLLVLLVVVHSVAMMFFEGLTFGDALWLSLTTITTVGYGDLSAATLAGRISSALFIYSVGITLLAQLGAEYMEYRLTIREMKLIGRWKWKKMKDHILIINAPIENCSSYLVELLSEIRATPELYELPVQILSDNFKAGLPEKVSALGVVQYSGVGQNNEDLQSVNVKQARYIIILAKDLTCQTTDSLNYDLLCRIKDSGTQAMVLSEVCMDANRPRMAKVGADIMVRPMRAYPGLLVRTLMAPGSEAVFENLFTHSDDHMLRFEQSFADLKWSDIVCRFVLAGAGTPMAYDNGQEIVVHPLPDALCCGKAIITMVNDSQVVTQELVARCLES